MKLSELEIVRVEICQIGKLAVLEAIQVGNLSDCKIRVGKCQDWNLSEQKIGACQNDWKLPELEMYFQNCMANLPITSKLLRRLHI